MDVKNTNVELPVESVTFLIEVNVPHVTVNGPSGANGDLALAPVEVELSSEDVLKTNLLSMVVNLALDPIKSPNLVTLAVVPLIVLFRTGAPGPLVLPAPAVIPQTELDPSPELLPAMEKNALLLTTPDNVTVVSQQTVRESTLLVLVPVPQMVPLELPSLPTKSPNQKLTLGLNVLTPMVSPGMFPVPQLKLMDVLNHVLMFKPTGPNVIVTPSKNTDLITLFPLPKTEVKPVPSLLLSMKPVIVSLLKTVPILAQPVPKLPNVMTKLPVPLMLVSCLLKTVDTIAIGLEILTVPLITSVNLVSVI